MRDAQPITRRAGRREWIGLAVIALPCLLYAMDLTVLFLAVPALTRDLDPSSSELLWITDIYGFMVAGLLVTMGRLGDRIGRRRLLLFGGAAFGATSVLAAFSTSPEMLILSRALLGIAGATLAPSTLALIRNMFEDPRQRTAAIGIWVTSFSVGAAIGPVVGGAVLEFAWWGSVFLLAVPVMALLLAVGPRLLPEYRDPEPGRFDLPGAALSIVAILLAVYGLKRFALGGAGVEPLVWIAAGLAVGALFVRRQRRIDDPLIDLRLFRAPAFSAALAANATGIFLIAGVDLFLALYLQLVLGMSPLTAGLWTLPSAAGFVAGSMVAPVLVRRLPTSSVVAAGLALAAAGLAALTQIQAGAGLAVLVAGSVLMAFGLAWAVTLGTDLIVGAAPPERAGAASAISETGAELGGALGIAILGSVGAAVYRDRVAGAVPSDAPAGAAASARDTLAGALDAAGQLPAGVVDAAARAFTDGLQVVAATGAVAALAMAMAAGVLLRRVAPAAEPEPAAAEPEAESAASPEPALSCARG